jgi:hypothetical protein
MMKRFMFTATLALLFAMSAASAHDDKHEHKHEPKEAGDTAGQPVGQAEAHEQHAAHEHGVARLGIAVGTEGLEISLDSPAANLAGFEHVPTADADKQKVKDMVEKLEAGDELFTLNAEAGCELKDTEVLSALHGDEMQTPATAELGEHSDMNVTWSYACAKPAELKEVAVRLFSAFPEGFQKISAEWVTDKGASAQELDKDDTLKLH